MRETFVALRVMLEVVHKHLPYVLPFCVYAHAFPSKTVASVFPLLNSVLCTLDPSSLISDKGKSSQFHRSQAGYVVLADTDFHSGLEADRSQSKHVTEDAVWL